jgi:galactokinase
VPFRPSAAGVASLVIDTRVAHSLADGAYARRRAQCEEAARQLGTQFLGQVTSVAETGRLEDPKLRRRARHVISDSARVRAIAAALTDGTSTDGTSDRDSEAGTADAYRRIGELLTEGHASLRDDFEVSWPEADVTVETAVGAGAYGAKMIGGGFGGSVLVLVPKTSLDAVCTAVTDVFAARAWGRPEFLDAVPAEAARRLS